MINNTVDLIHTSAHVLWMLKYARALIAARFICLVWFLAYYFAPVGEAIKVMVARPVLFVLEKMFTRFRSPLTPTLESLPILQNFVAANDKVSFFDILFFWPFSDLFSERGAAMLFFAVCRVLLGMALKRYIGEPVPQPQKMLTSTASTSQPLPSATKKIFLRRLNLKHANPKLHGNSLPLYAQTRR